MNYILVTGCSGFIGNKLTKTLLEKGYKVLGLSSSAGSLVSHNRFKYIQMDLTDSIAVEKLFDEYEVSAVIHLAAIAHLKGRKDIDWSEFYRVNVLASKTIFQCATKAKVRIFFASTVDVYGDVSAQIITEECKPKPISNYAQSKYIAEDLLKREALTDSVDYCIARFAPVYAKGFMKDINKRIYLKYPSLAFLIGGGNNYHFVSINNVIDFIVKWVSTKNMINGTYNVCDREYINSKDFIALEKSNGNAKKVIYLSNKMLTPFKILLELMYRLSKNSVLNKVRCNLYKLIAPPKYSIEKMKDVVSVEWNLKNTIYGIYEDIE